MSDYWRYQWPNLDSVSISLPIGAVSGMPAESVGVLYRLVYFIATKAVNTAYSFPNKDPLFREKDAHRIAQCSKKQWDDAKRDIREFFIVSNGEWRLADVDFIRITKPTVRGNISADTKSTVFARDGQRCVYCGTLEGPFRFDHLFPFSRGGSDDPSNLVIACHPCNAAKRDMTLREWMASQ